MDDLRSTTLHLDNLKVSPYAYLEKVTPGVGPHHSPRSRHIDGED